MKFVLVPALLCLLICSCSQPNKTNVVESASTINYGIIISEYLEFKKEEPTLIFNNTSHPNQKSTIRLLDNTISWLEKDNALEISINGNKLNTHNKVTLNNTSGTDVDSVNFANTVRQIKLYEQDALIGFVLTYEPCTGLGCNVNYQLIYDLKTKSESYFGCFKSGFEFELYDFNQDSRIDFLSKTFYEGHEQALDTIEYVLYNKASKGYFEEFSSKSQKRFSFRHMITNAEDESNQEAFAERWVEPIINSMK